MKPAFFHPKAREAIQEFPEEVRRELGKAIQSSEGRKARNTNVEAYGFGESRRRGASGEGSIGDLPGFLLHAARGSGFGAACVSKENAADAKTRSRFRKEALEGDAR